MLLCVNFQTLTQTIERIPTISTQLKIVATVKATMIGADGNLDSLCMNVLLYEDEKIQRVLCFRRFFPNLK